jgi:hypothetical protein
MAIFARQCSNHKLTILTCRTLTKPGALSLDLDTQVATRSVEALHDRVAADNKGALLAA